MSDVLSVERTGGLAGMAGPRSNLRSVGQIAIDSLSDADRKAVLALFASPPKRASSPVRDGFVYRLTMTVGGKAKTVEAPEASVPDAVIGCVKDELR